MPDNLSMTLLIVLIALSIGAVAFVIMQPLFSGQARATRRLQRIAGEKSRRSAGPGGRERQMRNQRRKAVQDTLKQIEIKQKEEKKRLTLRAMLAQAGLRITLQQFWAMSAVCGLLLGLLVLLTGSGLIVSLVAAGVGTFGIPRWILTQMRKRRQNAFLNEFANAIDVMVRSLKAGLPINDALMIIANESPPPIGPEFLEIVEGQKVGIPLNQGLERLYERMPLAEVNFLAIVINVQMASGGNLSEVLSNLSRVLRDRKKMKAKIQSVSQEAKSSAAIIGALPPGVMIMLYLTRPDYISELWLTPLGQVLLAGSALWMLMGVLVMRKMINFDF